MKDVRVGGPGEVTFVLTRPLAPFLRNLAMPPFAIGSPAAIKAEQSHELRPVGSGPYALGEWIKDDHITLTANPAYTGPLGKPAVGTAIIRDIPDQSTSVLSIQQGDIDMLTDPRPDDAKRLSTEPGITVVRQPANNVGYLALNVEKKPFDNVLVRQAVAQAIDLPAIVAALYAPGSIVGDNFIPRGMLGENPSKIWPHDAAPPARSSPRPVSQGLRDELVLPTSPRPYMPEPQRLAEAIQANLKAAGIEVTLQPFEFAVFLSKVRNGLHDMCLIGWTGDNGDPDNFYYTLLDQDAAHKGDAQNYSFWRDPVFHKLMLAGQRATDDASRAPIYRQAAQLVHDQVPVVSIVHTGVLIVLRNRISVRPDARIPLRVVDDHEVSHGNH